MGLVETRLVGFRRRLEHLVGVVEHESDVAKPPDTRLRAHGRDADLDAREAERALLGLARAVVEVDLLVGTAGDALTPAATCVLIDEDDAVLLALVDRPARAARRAAGVEAVFADPRDVEHVRLLELHLHVVLHPVEDDVTLEEFGVAAEVVVPVGRPLDVHRLAGDERVRPRDGGVLLKRRLDEGVVVVGPRLVVVLEARQHRVGEDLEQLLEPATRAQLEPAALREHPAALPAFLVLVRAGVAEAGAGLDVVPPDVLSAGTVGPRLLARDRAGVAADALVEVHHHRHLCHHAHGRTSVG